ncbi:MAG: hypothetical protein ABIP19_12775 [Dermatophilaceae bacterium]
MTTTEIIEAITERRVLQLPQGPQRSLRRQARVFALRELLPVQTPMDT